MSRLLAPVVVGVLGGTFATFVQSAFEPPAAICTTLVLVDTFPVECLAEGLAMGIVVPAILFLLWDQTRMRALVKTEPGSRDVVGRVLLGAIGALLPALLVWLHFMGDWSAEPGVLGLLPPSFRVAAGVGVVAFAAFQFRWALHPRPPLRLDRPFACWGSALATHLILGVIAGLHLGRPVPLSWL